MKISHRHKFIFFSNPKTGSESLREFLDPISEINGIPFLDTRQDYPFYAHMRPIETQSVFRNLGWNYEDYYRFTCVRNPWARLVSLYFMIKKSDNRFNEPFSIWLKGTSTDGSGGGGADFQRWRKYGTYSLRNFIGGDLTLVDDIFKMEELKAIAPHLAARGLPVQPSSAPKHLNSGSEPREYRDFYTDDLINLVADRYAEEIEIFDYKFE